MTARRRFTTMAMTLGLGLAALGCDTEPPATEVVFLGSETPPVAAGLDGAARFHLDGAIPQPMRTVASAGADVIGEFAWVEGEYWPMVQAAEAGSYEISVYLDGDVQGGAPDAVGAVEFRQPAALWTDTRDFRADGGIVPLAELWALSRHDAPYAMLQLVDGAGMPLWGSGEMAVDDGQELFYEDEARVRLECGRIEFPGYEWDWHPEDGEYAGAASLRLPGGESFTTPTLHMVPEEAVTAEWTLQLVPGTTAGRDALWSFGEEVEPEPALFLHLTTPDGGLVHAGSPRTVLQGDEQLRVDGLDPDETECGYRFRVDDAGEESRVELCIGAACAEAWVRGELEVTSAEDCELDHYACAVGAAPTDRTAAGPLLVSLLAGAAGLAWRRRRS